MEYHVDSFTRPPGERIEPGDISIREEVFQTREKAIAFCKSKMENGRTYIVYNELEEQVWPNDLRATRP